MQKIPSILHKNSTFSILHNQFYKTPTSVHLLYTIFDINNIFMFFFNIILPTRFFFQYFLFFFLLSFSLSLLFPLSFLPLLSSSSSHIQNPKAPKQELHQHHSHHKHHNAFPIHRSPSTQRHHHKHFINTDLRQPTKLISINTDLRQPITSTPSTPISINTELRQPITDLHQHRSTSPITNPMILFWWLILWLIFYVCS